MRRYSLTLTVFALLAFCLLACDRRQPSAADGEGAAAIDTLPRLVTQVRECSRLYTTEYRIRKVVTHDDVVRLKGNFLRQDFDIALPLGERKIAIPMTATLKAYIDFAGFSEKNIERHGRKITLLLPDPKVVLTSTKIDQEGIKEYVGLVRPHFTDSEMAAYERQGRQTIIESVPDLDILETARRNAARVLVPMVVQLGYDEEDVIVAFRKDLDVTRLIDTNIEKKQ